MGKSITNFIILVAVFAAGILVGYKLLSKTCYEPVLPASSEVFSDSTQVASLRSLLADSSFTAYNIDKNAAAGMSILSSQLTDQISGFRIYSTNCGMRSVQGVAEYSLIVPIGNNGKEKYDAVMKIPIIQLPIPIYGRPCPYACDVRSSLVPGPVVPQPGTPGN
ncbi:MAG: hypothetical protein ABIV51_00135 [Saprospiraceae bacterium]